MRPALPTLVAALLLALPTGCSKRNAEADAGAVEAPVDAGRPIPAAPPPIDVRASRSDLIWSWTDEAGAWHDTQKADEVPAAFRKQVLVRDLSLRPEEAHADSVIYVADLTATPEQGEGFPYAIVSRFRFKQPTLAVDATGAVVDRVGVTVYGTSWCGACAQARAWLTEQKVPFTDKDVEADPAAASELARKAKAAGIQPRGVPVLDVKGTLLEGFSPSAVASALQRPGTGAAAHP